MDSLMPVQADGAGGSGSTLRAEAGAEDFPQLMVQVQAGDAGAYRRLLGAIHPLLRALARRGLGRAEDAEDAVQDILLTLHRVRHTYDPARPFLPWLFAIARRRIIDRQRQAGRSRRRETEFTAEHETFLPGATNTSPMEIDLRALQEAIGGLTPAERHALELLKLKELSLKEASAISGMSVASLKVASHRAVKRLRTLLQGGEP
jgi:RNA polymerase sigma-70 factor (ECF subfamily)